MLAMNSMSCNVIRDVECFVMNSLTCNVIRDVECFHEEHGM